MLLPAVRIRVPVGSALAIDGRARWRAVCSVTDDADSSASSSQAACVVYEYRSSQLTQGVVDAALSRATDLLSTVLRGCLVMVTGSLPVSPPVKLSGTAAEASAKDT